jgi:DNA repair protein RecO (recombination protein O)
MSHHRYQTDGIVIAGRDSGESSRYLTLYTRELGLVAAWAQGVRELTSKLKPGTQRCTETQFELVRGKGVWRVVGAHPLKQHDTLLRMPGALARTSRVLDLVVRITDEGSDPQLYQILATFLDVMERFSTHPSKLRSVELLGLARLLHHLGYLPQGDLSLLQSSYEWDDATLERLEVDRASYLARVRHTIAHLHISTHVSV